MTEQEIMDFEDYVLSLLARWCGVLHLSPNEFYDSTLQEIALSLKAHQSAVEETYYLNLIAGYNGNGYFNAKNFKPIQPFEEKASTSHKAKDKRQEAEESLAFLRQHASKGA